MGILKEKEAPAGALKTRICIFEGKKAPAGALKTRMCIFEEILKMLIFGSCWEWAGLVWEMFLDLVGVFIAYLEAPRSHIEKNKIFNFVFFYMAPGSL